MLSGAAALPVIALTKLITGARGIWRDPLSSDKQRIFYANHSSHADFVLIWAVLPPPVRHKTRPVAAADYWTRSALRRVVGTTLFNAVLIDRASHSREHSIAAMIAALDNGASLIFFPEGTRNTTEAPLLPFKSGIYHLAKNRPDIDLVPVWIDNISRVMPKGELIPIPLLCSVIFGAALQLEQAESKDAFVERARARLLSLRPQCESA
jgi:1-acyl-sn-glycerol-3-phosphate acyltransferase